MKTITKLIVVLLLSANTFSQQWFNTWDFNNRIRSVHFVDATSGWIITDRYNQNPNHAIYRTYNKGINWTEINQFNAVTGDGYGSSIFFINQNTGFRAYYYNNYVVIDKTENGGSYWYNVFYRSCNSAVPLLKFTNASTGFLVISFTLPSSRRQVEIYKTYDGGSSWNSKYSFSNSNFNFVMQGLGISSYGGSTSILAVGYREHATQFYTDYYGFLSTNNGESFINAINPSYTGFLNSYISVIGLNNQNFTFLIVGVKNQQYVTPGTYCTRFEGGNIIGDNYINDNTNNTFIGGVTFKDQNTGFTVIYDKVYWTNNSGASWNLEYTANDQTYYTYNVAHSFGDVGYFGGWHGKFYTNKITGDLHTMYDWTDDRSGSMAIDGDNSWTPRFNYNYRGGTCALYALPFIKSGDDTTARFYYWGGGLDGSLNWDNHNVYIVNSGTQINADYKSHLISTTGQVLKYANQVKAMRDTNGILNLVYESMGGIFYTRIKYNNGDKFKLEECLSGTSSYQNGYVTFDNSNPYLTEIKHNGQNGSIDGEKNMAAVWERREGDNIRVMYNQRNCTGPYPNWWGPPENIFTLQSVPQGFKSYPKLSVNMVFSPTYYSQRFITYLKPAGGGNNKLVVHTIARFDVHRDLDLTQPEDIQEYAVAPVYPAVELGVPKWDAVELHVAYRKGQSVVYRHWVVYLDHLSEFPAEYKVVSAENSESRSSVDISLRNASNNPNNINVQPVITYQGQRNTIIIIKNDNDDPVQIPAVYYPIFVRERLSGGDWGPFIRYEIINTPQQTPIIEGSKQKNSCLLNYTQNSTTHIKVVPRWDGAIQPNTWFCNPTVFSGTDARLIKGSLINSSSVHDTLVTLTQNGGVYSIGRQHFTITNNPFEPGVEVVNGIVLNDNIKYSFNLGDIMVNWNTMNFDNVLDTAIEDMPDFNENFESKTFYLNDYDTLVIGRNAFYVPDDSSGTFQEIEYKVILINKSSGEMHELLADDTVHVGDSIQVEYLEGFVISNIPGGADSFYVQMEVDTLFFPDGGYSIGGSSGGEGGDNINTIKRNVFWKGENIAFKNNNLPTVFNLYQNYPNPFNPLTKIKFDLPKNVNVKIKLYDLLGREVTVLVNEFKRAGRYELEWNATNYASGVYIYRIEAGDYVNVKKMVLVK